jgi:type 1 glutamine amidotransferase
MMQMGKATEVYEAVESLDLREFEPANLKKYDGIILNNTTGSWLSPNPEKYPDDAALISKYGDAKKASQALLQSLLAFVEDGGAIIGYHSATDANKGTAFVPLIGGLFDGHPWGAGDTVNVKIDDPANPLLKAFGDKADFDITDEIYQFQQYDRSNVRVLMSLNVAKTNMDKKGIKRTDGDFPISWVRTQGKGRVFYCSLGHREDIFWNPVVMQYYLDGIQWALGDTDVPTESLPLKTADMGLDGDCPGCVHAPLANAEAKAAAE